MLSDFGIGCTGICSVSVVTSRKISAVSNWRAIVAITPLKSMSTKSPECWSSDPNARAVRIELSAERSLLLPFDQFAFAELKSEGREQRLRLVFATHEVVVQGHCLRRIEIAMQRMELSSLVPLVGNQRSLIPEGQPVVIEIVVTDMKPSVNKCEVARG